MLICGKFIVYVWIFYYRDYYLVPPSNFEPLIFKLKLLMRFFILLLILSATTGISAQQLLFDKTIPEQNIPDASRLKSEMRSHYINSRYVSQTDFLSQQDFFIAITSNLIVKSKFVKIHNYPSGSFSYEGRLEGPVTGQITF